MITPGLQHFWGTQRNDQQVTVVCNPVMALINEEARQPGVQGYNLCVVSF